MWRPLFSWNFDDKHEEDYKKLLEIMNLYKIRRIWLKFSDKETEGEWKDMDSGLIQPLHSIPWDHANEPTGGRAENCAGFSAMDSGSAFDISCSQK